MGAGCARGGGPPHVSRSRRGGLGGKAIRNSSGASRKRAGLACAKVKKGWSDGAGPTLARASGASHGKECCWKEQAPRHRGSAAGCGGVHAAVRCRVARGHVCVYVEEGGSWEGEAQPRPRWGWPSDDTRWDVGCGCGCGLLCKQSPASSCRPEAQVWRLCAHACVGASGVWTLAEPTGPRGGVALDHTAWSCVLHARRRACMRGAWYACTQARRGGISAPSPALTAFLVLEGGAVGVWYCCCCCCGERMDALMVCRG